MFHPSVRSTRIHPRPFQAGENFVCRKVDHSVRWGWVFLKRTKVLSGIHFTRYFIEFFLVESKRFVVSNVNVILTRQVCGQRSSMSTRSKRRALKHLAAAHHSKYGIPVGGFLHCTVFFWVPRGVSILVSKSLRCPGSCPFSPQKTRFF